MKLEIAEARSEIMAPLSAASMESYSRAYPYLVKLHMLQVAALITHLLRSRHTDPALEQLLAVIASAEEEEFYKLQPANNTDHLCQSWQ